jgi:hypothetical protein
MLYYLLYQLIYRQYGATSESIFYKGLNVIQYVTFSHCSRGDQLTSDLAPSSVAG